MTLLSAIRMALMVNQGARALDRALELVRVLAGVDGGVSRRLLELADDLAGVECGELDRASCAALAAYRRASG